MRPLYVMSYIVISFFVIAPANFGQNFTEKWDIYEASNLIWQNLKLWQHETSLHSDKERSQNLDFNEILRLSYSIPKNSEKLPVLKPTNTLLPITIVGTPELPVLTVNSSWATLLFEISITSYSILCSFSHSFASIQ